MEKLLSEMKKGLTVLEKIREKDPEIFKIWLYAGAGYLHFSADYDQTRFSFLKRKQHYDKEQIGEILSHAAEGTKKLISLQRLDCKIGYEASNHYFYTTRSLKEKLLNLHELACRLREEGDAQQQR